MISYYPYDHIILIYIYIICPVNKYVRYVCRYRDRTVPSKARRKLRSGRCPVFISWTVFHLNPKQFFPPGKWTSISREFNTGLSVGMKPNSNGTQVRDFDIS